MLDPKRVIEAVERLSCLSMFPSADGARTEIMRLIDRMVSTPEQLEWLVRTMVDQVGEWKGPRELRAVLCTRFKPADGIGADSELPGFRAADIEAENASRPVREITAGPEDFPIDDIRRQIEERVKRLN